MTRSAQSQHVEVLHRLVGGGVDELLHCVGNGAHRDDHAAGDPSAHRTGRFDDGRVAIPHETAGAAADDVHRAQAACVDFWGGKRFHQGLRCAPTPRRHDNRPLVPQRSAYPLGADDYEPSTPRVDSHHARSWGASGKIIRHAGGILAVALVFSLLGILARGFAPHEIGICTASLS